MPTSVIPKVLTALFLGCSLDHKAMDNHRKAELKRAYKETVKRKGVFRVHSTATGESWVDTSPDLDSIKNRIWFTLRMGTHPNKKLQQTWNESGAEAMELTVVETFEEDVTGYDLERLMKERKEHWLEELQAEPYK